MDLQHQTHTPSADRADTSGPAGSGRAPLRYWDTVQPWLTLACRLGLVGVLSWAAISKLPPALSVQTVEAYDLFPTEVAELIGYTLPLFELALALLLLVGLATRYVGGATGVLMIVFIAGIISAWARGLHIDCGCFGVGGEVAPGETTYGTSILRDLGFLAMASVVALWPRSPLALDRLFGVFR